MNKSNEIIDIFKQANEKTGNNVALSVKSLKKRSRLSRKQIIAILYREMENETIRRVDPLEVGSNVYIYREPPTDKKRERDTAYKKYAKCRRAINKTLEFERKFNVFALVQ
tara:strand:- start:254 stop:586 length:333 start_codon:yes stop_codon:yes gene_type:complete